MKVSAETGTADGVIAVGWRRSPNREKNPTKQNTRNQTLLALVLPESAWALSGTFSPLITFQAG